MSEKEIVKYDTFQEAMEAVLKMSLEEFDEAAAKTSVDPFIAEACGMFFGNDIEEEAHAFAQHAHRNQKRKYTDEPYFVHCAGVAMILQRYGYDDENILAAAYLHDVVEDTEYTLVHIKEFFNETIAQLVEEVSDPSKPSDGNRATRKQIDLDHLTLASKEGGIIKCADILHNCQSIFEYDPNFARVFIPECYKGLCVLKCKDEPIFYDALTTLLEGAKRFNCLHRTLTPKGISNAR